MKALLFSEALKMIKTSGLGRAILHQKRALQLHGIHHTTNPQDIYDIVHINTVGVQSKLLAKKAKKRGIPVVYHAHSTEEDFRNSFRFSNLVSPLYRVWLRSCYRSGDVVVTPTAHSKRVLEKYNLDKEIFAVSNGIDLDFYTPSPNDRAEFRGRYNIKEDDKVIISAGFFFKRKGILDFVQLAEEMPDYKFIWFGDISLAAVPKEIRKAVKTKLPNLIFAGFVPQLQLKQAYVGADLFLFPTYEENEGIVLLEALACNCHVLLRDIPTFDWLEGDKDVHKAKDYNEMLVKIQGILENQLPDLRENGYKVVSEKSLIKVGEQLKKIYTSLL